MTVSTIAQAQRAIADKLTSPSELVADTLQKIEQSDKALNANITICKETALKRAQELDQMARSGQKGSMPLLGVPISVKDLLCTKGIRTTAASKMLENFIPAYDAHVVSKLEKAGAVIVAKSNLDEFAMGATTEFSYFGKTHNPWNKDCIPGGSSGGSAASVAAGQVLASIGTDSGGSIRQPAALCGCVGLKPTYGTVSRYGIIAYASSFDQAGPLAATVEDCAILFDVIAGYDEKDPTSSRHTLPNTRAALNRNDLKGLTVGLPKEFWQLDIAPEVRQACELAVDKAKQAGATIIEVSMPYLEYGVASYYILTAAEASTNMARYDGVRFGLRVQDEHDDLIAMYTKSRTAGFGEEVKRRILLGTYVLSAGYYDSYYKKAAQIRRLIHDDFVTALTRCDVLMAPTTSRTAWEFGKFADNPLEAYKMDYLTLSANLAGVPTLSLPAGLGKDSGLPIGIQIFGKHFAEATVLSTAQVLEQHLPPLGKPPLW